jgi:GTPase SAR1 family protein
MPIVLPTQRVEVKRTMPKIMILYGPPKVGKSTFVSKLDKALILDSEEGHMALNSVYLNINSTTDVDEVVNAIIKKGTELKGQYPYDFIVLDTIDQLEKYAENSATKKYKTSTKGKNFDGDTVLELDFGLGYYYLREETMKRIHNLAKVCRHLILIAHVRPKALDKGGISVEVNELSLTGRLGSMICNMADAIGYVYREKKTQELTVSFKAPSDDVTMGCRYPYLAGKIVPADWSILFPEYDYLKAKPGA